MLLAPYSLRTTVGAGSSATCGKAATASKIAVRTVSVGAS